MSDLPRARRARANAFDLNRTDRDDVDVTPAPPPLGDLLPRVTSHPPEPRYSSEGPPASAPAVVASPAQSTARPRGERPRGSGGRATPASATSRFTATAARIPVDLYDRAEVLVKGRGLPSWGQLIAWTCSTRQSEVVQEVLTLLRPVEGVLVPRGQNKRGAAATQITARFTAAEQGAFEGTRSEAQRAAAASDFPTDVTATAVVTAALTVAARSSH